MFYNISPTIEFYSDIVYIRDKQPKPYFKWFRDLLNNNEQTKFKFIQEFLIPKLTFWNFHMKRFENNELTIEWVLSYSEIVYFGNRFSLSKLNEEIKINLLESTIAKLFDKKISNTIIDAIIKARVGQSEFRKKLLKSTSNSCVFTKINNPELLIAGHIKSWKISSDEEKLDEENGILLTPTFDKLFDKHLVTFNEEGYLLWSEHRIDKASKNILIKSIENYKDIRVHLTNSNQKYFDHHREKFNELEKLDNGNN